MFERYTEKARRVIFFARYEASHYGSPEIDTEHLLLGLLREDKTLHHWLPKTNHETVRHRIDEHSPKRPSTSTHVDLPLSEAGNRVLKYAAVKLSG
jgi:ATP-dependent Clp protease ATP-binding subunit ClpC